MTLVNQYPSFSKNMQQATFAYRATKQQLRYVENKITFDKVKHVNKTILNRSKILYVHLLFTHIYPFLVRDGGWGLGGFYQ
jgi:hypothetical protein